MMKISGAMEGCIKQNNGIDIYVEYFDVYLSYYHAPSSNIEIYCLVSDFWW